MALIPDVKEGDWHGLNKILKKLSTLRLGSESTPTFGGLTINGDLSVTGKGTFDSLVVDTDTLVVNVAGFEDRVGIGTTSPKALLHLKGPSATLRIQDDGASTDYFELQDTSSSQAKLNKFAASGGVVIDFNPMSGDNSNVSFRLFSGTNTTGAKKFQLFKGDGTAVVHAQFGVEGTDSFFQIGGGNVGIGTASPGEKLEVNGDILVSGLTATRLVSTDANKKLVSSDLNSWVAGTTNQVIITDDSDGTITLSTPQDIHTGAGPTFAGLTISGHTNTSTLTIT